MSERLLWPRFSTVSGEESAPTVAGSLFGWRKQQHCLKGLAEIESALNHFDVWPCQRAAFLGSDQRIA